MNKTIDKELFEAVEELEAITLEQMKEVRLMNRTDAKFVTSKQKLLQLLEAVKGKYYSQHNASGSIASYRTIYWDTDDFHFFTRHQCGHYPRQKVRVRTYMDSGEQFLEIKTKDNHKRTKKKRICIDGASIAEQDEFVLSRTGIEFGSMHKALQNEFNRMTLVNKAKTERLTIDFNVQFHNFDTGLDTGTGDLVIIELKRDGNVASPILEILTELRIFPAGFSKYCIGSALTNNGLRLNNIKEKLVTVSKLIDQGGGFWPGASF